MVVKRYKDFLYVKCGDKKTAEEVKAKNPPEVIFFDADGEEISRTSVKSATDVDRAMNEALKKYAPRKTVHSMLSQAGFSSIMNLHALFGDIGFDQLSSESLAAALDATQDEANFMAHPYTCDRKQMSLTTAVCNSYVRIMRYREAKAGRKAGLVEVSDGWVSAASLIA